MTILSNLLEQYNSLQEHTRRFVLIATAVVLLVVVLYTSLISHLSTLSTRLVSREQTLKEMILLRQRHQEATVVAQRLANRMASATAADTVANIIEQTVIIPKGSIQSKPLPRQERGTILEEGSEVTLSGLTLNESVNLLYRLEQGAKPVAIKKIVIRSRFNDPAKLDLVLQVSLYRPSGNQEKK